MTDQWQELKETIIELRDNDGTGTQQEICKFLANYMETLEKQMQESYKNAIDKQTVNNLIDELAKAISDERCGILRGRSPATIMRDIRHLPPVVSQQKVGHWIKMPLVEAGQTYSHECSLCGRRILVTDKGLSEFPYCHCGAKMQEIEK